MKEFDVTFDKGLTKGLRQFTSGQRNSLGLTTLRNAKPSETGLIPYEPLTDRDIATTVTHPKPQLFIGEKYRILADQGTIYEISDAWAKTSKLSGLSTDDVWDMADFRDYFVMTNGAVIVYIDLVTSPGVAAYNSMASSSTFPRFLTCCAFKGQLIGGNVKTSWHDASTYSVVWSGIGNVDFTPDAENDAGYMHGYKKGNVLRVLRLGDVVMVYCDNGIFALKPKGQFYGKQEILDIGIPAKSAVNGNFHKHVFVDSNDYVWRITSDLKAERLGYQEFISPMTQGSIVVSHDWEKDEFYITDGTTSFLLTNFGLCETFLRPTSVGAVDGDSVGTFTSASDVTMLATTDVMDFGLRGMKTVGNIELGIDDDSTVQVAADYRYNKATAWASTGWKTVNLEGVAWLGITAVEFRLKVKASAYANVNLDYITAKIKVSDKRYVRGIGASQAFTK